jgi:hypothetical protein
VCARRSPSRSLDRRDRVVIAGTAYDDDGTPYTAVARLQR